MKTVLFVAAVCLVAALLLVGCGKNEPPIFITSQLPAIPGECIAPSTAEPKVRAGDDATDLDAVKDRNRLKYAFRNERDLRKTCGDELKVLLPQQ